MKVNHLISINSIYFSNGHRIQIDLVSEVAKGLNEILPVQNQSCKFESATNWLVYDNRKVIYFIVKQLFPNVLCEIFHLDSIIKLNYLDPFHSVRRQKNR